MNQSRRRFVGRCAAVVSTSAVSAVMGRMAEASQTQPLRNWAGNYQYRTNRITPATSVAQIQEFVRKQAQSRPAETFCRSRAARTCVRFRRRSSASAPLASSPGHAGCAAGVHHEAGRVTGHADGARPRSLRRHRLRRLQRQPVHRLAKGKGQRSLGEASRREG